MRPFHTTLLTAVALLRTVAPRVLNGAATQAIVLSGKVVGPDRRPVTGFTVAAGPGKIPGRCDCILREVQDPEGHFDIEVPERGRTWIGIRAEQFAAWEGWVDLGDHVQPIEVRMSPGFNVSARVVSPKDTRKRIKGILFPRREKSRFLWGQTEPLAEEFPTRIVSLSADGILRFDHVRPDRYRLFLRVDGITKAVFALDIPAADIELGPIPLDATLATGRVEGRVWRPKGQISSEMASAKGEVGGEWSFAEGYLRRPRVDGEDLIEPTTNRRGEPAADSVAIRTDKAGRFRVDGVPEGLVTVAFAYQTPCQRVVYTWTAVVRIEQTTTIRAFDPADRQDLTLNFVIGDGSKEQQESGAAFRRSDVSSGIRNTSQETSGSALRRFSLWAPAFGVKLIPLSRQPISAPADVHFYLDAGDKHVLSNADPGDFRLAVYDRQYTRQTPRYPDGSDPPQHDALVDRKIAVHCGANEENIALGPGCITGKVLIPANRDRRPTLISRPRGAEVIAVARNGHNYIRRAELESENEFRVRYLYPGPHSLYIHDPISGYCLIDRILVPAGFVDAGERTLTAGAIIRGTLHYPRISRVPDEVVAKGPSGVTLREALPSYSSFDRFEFGGLWPGPWEISVQCSGTVLATRGLVLEKTDIHDISITVGTERGHD